MNNLNTLSLLEAQTGLKEKKFSCLELVGSCLDRIKKIDQKLKTFVTVNSQNALAQAEATDRLPKNKDTFLQKPLLGIPVAVKDNFCTQNLRTTASSKVLEEFVPPYDATVVAKLKEAGAIILGKTNMDAWAHGSSTESSDFFTTKNPWNTDYLPGGSSGGSAASVASDETIFAIGSETAGSIRQPAAWCGVTGLKPTYGRVSRYGVIAMASSTDSPGPITKTVKDAAFILKIIAGQDRFDATLSPRPVEDYLDHLGKGVKGLVLGVPQNYFLPEMTAEVSTSVKKGIAVLAKLGAKIVPVKLLDPRYSLAVYTILQRSEVSSNLARYDGLRFGRGRQFFGAEAKRRIMLGTYALSAGYYDQYYLKALKVRHLILKDFEKIFEKVDLLVAPTSPCPALKIGATKGAHMFGELQDILVEASSLAGLPGINLCCGFNKNNLPIGLQIFGPQFSETQILNAAFAYEQATDWHQRRPRL